MAASTKVKIDPDIAKILRNAVITGPNRNHLKIEQKLDPKVYKACAKILELLGGKWNRSAQATVFDKPITEVLDEALGTGEVVNKKNLFQSFYTPDFAADILVRHADLKVGQRIMEPEAGEGALVDAIFRAIGTDSANTVDMIEFNPEAVAILRKKYPMARHGDFLQFEPTIGRSCDRIVMNPPFSNGQDAEHILHALDFLRPGGVLVAIVPANFLHKDVNPYKRLLEICHSDFCETFGDFDLPEETFKESGTNIATKIFKFVRAQEKDDA
jgi:predicted RNA methylase